MDTLEEWSDGNIQESDQTPRGEKRKNNEWSDSGDDEIIRGIQESDQVGCGGKNVKAMIH